jgi:glucose-6-phosphate 1-dehydrogenase
VQVLANNHSHFLSAEELDASWRIFTPALHELEQRKIKPEPYPFGSRGPAAADDLARRYGMRKFGGGLTPYVSPFNLGSEAMSRGSKEQGEGGA